MNKTLLITAVLGAVMALLCACEGKESDTTSTPAPTPAATPAATSVYDPARDYFSFAEPGDFRVRHLELDLTVDFEKKALLGHAILHIDQVDPKAQWIMLDSRDLAVERVQLLSPAGEPVELEFQFGESDAIKGEALSIALPEGFQAADFQLRIDYHTNPAASAIMWLPAELTAGGEHPFMFTQSQSIHARSWVPLQDTPAVRFTYEASIRTPVDLLALMSADNEPLAERDGHYHFSMPQPIPSYLLALAVGNVYFAPVGDQTGVYAEPEVLTAAAWEFADTQAMLDAAEAKYGPYQWGRYDLLILPPSFPYGGMENPRLSFITPTVLAGDRSLVSLIAHELAHSWSGNLVSNATWRDIWLNEGTTSYFESRLMEELFGKDRADEERLLSFQDLHETLPDVVPAMQALAPEFSSGDPDVGQDGLQYTKGQLLWENLEKRFGRDVFDRFLTGYFKHFEFQAITSEQFLDYLDAELLTSHPGIYNREQVEAWLYEPGVPADAILPKSTNLERAAGMAVAWSSGETEVSELPFESWSPQATVYFIKALPVELPAEQLQALDDRAGLSASGNVEITRAWFTQVAARNYRTAYGAMRSYLARNGRIRLLEPVYKALIANGEDRELARGFFMEDRVNYHPLTVAAIEALFQKDTPD